MHLALCLTLTARPCIWHYSCL